MATVNFLYRSTRKEAPLIVRLLFTHEGKNYVFGVKTKLIVTKDYWSGDHNKQRIADIERSNYQKEVKQQLTDIENFILEAFYNNDLEKVNNEWLKTQLEHFYNPPKELPLNNAPLELINFFDYYSDIKKGDLSTTRIKRLTVVKNKLIRFEKSIKKTILIPDVNDIFKKDFLKYCSNAGYANSSVKSDFSVIKTVCKYAGECNIKISPQLKNLKTKHEILKKPYLTFDELEKIKNADFPKGGSLDNVRDWLLISCYTGQRISDFMKFTSKNVHIYKGKINIEFKQVKTDKEMSIPFLKEAYEIYKKNGDNFPRAISDQRYNEYIKDVCRIAGIDTLTKGMVLVCIAENTKKAGRNDYRRELQTVPKYELVSSHIGRRSFATNYYYKGLPVSVLMDVTGHSTEKMFLEYIQAPKKEKAYNAHKYFE